MRSTVLPQDSKPCETHVRRTPRVVVPGKAVTKHEPQPGSKETKPRLRAMMEVVQTAPVCEGKGLAVLSLNGWTGTQLAIGTAARLRDREAKSILPTVLCFLPTYWFIGASFMPQLALLLSLRVQARDHGFTNSHAPSSRAHSACCMVKRQAPLKAKAPKSPPGESLSVGALTAQSPCVRSFGGKGQETGGPPRPEQGDRADLALCREPSQLLFSDCLGSGIGRGI